ncbi:MAG: AAA family ATPase [Cytophagales bacterium]|nr:AAA family ATPase [Cytophagales bacterium]MDW8383298.1 AAA family ATPase [Flammeovirgaceae bacterium]
MIFGKKNKLYKFKELKFFTSPSTLVDGKRKYRKVFDVNELGTLFVEVSLFNKKFDIETWTAYVAVKFFKSDNYDKPYAENAIQSEVYPSDAIARFYVNVRNYRGSHFWSAGEYLCEVWINGEFAGKDTLYIHNVGITSEDDNPYFMLKKISLYRDSNLPSSNGRLYLKEFDANTPAIGIEIAVEGHFNTSPLTLEFILNCYDSNGFLKISQNELVVLNPPLKYKDTLIHTTLYANEIPWPKDIYRLEIIFMDILIAVLYFRAGWKDIPGEVEFTDTILEDFSEPFDSFDTMFSGTLERKSAKREEKHAPVEESLEVLLKELDSLVGLHEIKKRIHDYVEYIEFLKLRESMGFQEDKKFNLHSVFLGNPGTGKTTIAKLIGKIYHKLGLLSNGTVHEVGRNELIGQYIGQTAPKVKEMIENARGGVLFIDEAYSLMRSSDDERDYGNEAIEVLVKEMSDGEGDIAIFAAGYPKEMNVFLNSNPGLRSRFGLTLEFPDYLPQELLEILEKLAEQKKVKFTEEAKQLLHRHIIEEYRNRDKSFGNARFVQNLVEEAKKNLGLRVMRSVPEQDRTLEIVHTITREDVMPILEKKKCALPNIPIDEAALQEALSELDSLTGLTKVKKEIKELVQLVRFYKLTHKEVLGKFSLHTVFKGNPGTGKTTVARIIANIYKALGILERGHLVECDRQHLVAGYVGQTALKTKEIIERAKGGVLFIDEAYALAPTDAHHDFGIEAIEILLKAMEDYRFEFVVIVAGYPEEMKKFLDANPGLRSRFDREFYFEDLDAEELYQVALRMLSKENLTPDPQAAQHLQKFINKLYQQRNKFFGNARSVRKIVEKAIRNQHIRLSKISAQEYDAQMLSTLTLEDVEEFNEQHEMLASSKPIGF